MENGIEFYKEYFQECATNHKLLAHGTNNKKAFVFSIFDDLINQERSLQYPALVVLDADIRLNDYRANQVTAKVTGAFAIIDNPGKDDSAEAKETIITNCSDIARDVISKMYKDRKKLLFNNLNIDAMNISVIEKINGECIGVMVDYEFEKPVNIAFILNNWNNETT
jgi:hypothetical protein